MDKDEVIKIADFGLARDLATDSYYRVQTTSIPLPVKWMAVECLQERKFTLRSDVVRSLRVSDHFRQDR